MATLLACAATSAPFVGSALDAPTGITGTITAVGEPRTSPETDPPATDPSDTEPPTTDPETSAPTTDPAPGDDGGDNDGGATAWTWVAIGAGLALVGVAIWWVVRAGADRRPMRPMDDDWPTDSDVI